jgi:hypothetical protein
MLLCVFLEKDDLLGHEVGELRALKFFPLDDGE